MKNTKLSVSLIACLLSVGGLAGCSKVKSSSDGFLLTYKVDGGDEIPITAEEILEKSYNDSSKYQAIFDIIYSALVKNYFNREAAVNYYGKEIAIGKGQMGNPDDVAHGSEGSIYGKANQKVEDDIDTAHTNADANNTRYKKELETILESHGVKTVEELKEKYVEEIQKETFEKNFYTYYVEDLKQGAGATRLWNQEEDTSLRDFWPGYFKDQMPYHVSHILVKLEDGSGTNYTDGTISEDNAKKLSNVVSALGRGEDTFFTIAKQYSEDTGSAKLSGDLGIMDTSTSFVNEFKLGVYAYENYYGQSISDVKGETIDAQSFSKNYADAVKKSFGEDELYVAQIDSENSVKIPMISNEVFDWLKDVAKDNLDDKKDEVLDNNASFYPRNIIYNKYLNRHSVAFVTGDVTVDVKDPEDNTKVLIPGLDTEQKKADAKEGRSGYITYPDNTPLGKTGKAILSVKVSGEWRPILCVRAGSDYQGIHFIVVNRSPLETGVDAEGVNQSNYYTVFWPNQKDDYPVYKEQTGKHEKGEQMPTYINFSSDNDNVSETKKRAEELASKLKSFDSDRLSKYIFKKYLAEEKVVIKQEVMRDKLEKWIETSINKAVEERKENWNKTWKEYIDTLSRQGNERSKLIPQACRLAYKQANNADKTEYTLENLLMEKLEVTDVNEFHNTAVYKEIVELFGEENYAKFKDEAISKSFKTKGGLCNDGKEHL